MSRRPAPAPSRKPGRFTVTSFTTVVTDGPDVLARLEGRWSNRAPASGFRLEVGEQPFDPLEGSVVVVRSKRHAPRWRVAFAVSKHVLEQRPQRWALRVGELRVDLPRPVSQDAADGSATPPAPEPAPGPAQEPEAEDVAWLEPAGVEDPPPPPPPFPDPGTPPAAATAEELAAENAALRARAAALEAEVARLHDELAAAERQLELRAFDGPDRPVFTLPAIAPERLGAATGLLGAGAALVAVAAAFAALRVGVAAPQALVVLLLGSGAGIALLWRPEWLLPVFLGLTWTSIGGRFFGGFPSPIEIGGVLLAPVAGWLALSRLRYAKEVMLIAGLLLVPVVATGLVSPEGPVVGTDRIKDLLFLVVVALCVRGSADVERVYVALAAIAVFLGAGAVFSVLVGPTELFPLNEEPTSDQAARAAGPFGESNFFALSLAALVPLLMHLVLRGGWRSLLGTVAMGCALAGILAAGSRGGLIAAGCGLVAYGVLTGGRARLVAAVTVAIGALMLPVFAAQAQSSQGRKVDGRLTENLIAVKMFTDHPLVGVGPERYPANYRDYTRRMGDDPRYEREAHSLPLQIAAEQGLAGILGWLGAILALLHYARVRRLWQDRVARAALLSIFTFGVGSLFLHGSQLRLLYVLAGLTLACGAAARHRAPTVPRVA